MKKVLITGGLGFIGARLSNELLNKGYEITIIDNCSTNIIDAPIDKVNFLQLDINDQSPENLIQIENAISNTDLIYHLAGSVGVKHIDENPHKCIQNNYFMSANIFPLCEKYQKKVVFASTSEVYGETDNAKETDSLMIGTPEVLRWGYACNKLMSEFLISSFSFPFVIARLFNITGKGQIGKHGMVSARFIEKVQKGEKLTIFDDGKQVRSFCDIRDGVQMLILLGENSEHNGEIYNIGNENNETSILNLAKLILKKSKSDLELEYIPFDKAFSKQTKDIRTRKPNTNKIQKYYKCKYSLDDIITSMLNQ